MMLCLRPPCSFLKLQAEADCVFFFQEILLGLAAACPTSQAMLQNILCADVERIHMQNRRRAGYYSSIHICGWEVVCTLISIHHARLIGGVLELLFVFVRWSFKTTFCTSDNYLSGDALGRLHPLQALQTTWPTFNPSNFSTVTL